MSKGTKTIDFDKGKIKTIQWGKNSLIKKYYWDNWMSTCKMMNQDICLITFTKMNSKWITEQNTRHKTIKLLKENLGVNVHDPGLGNDFLDPTPKAQATTKNYTQ